MPVVPWVSTDSLRSPHISPSDCPALTVLLFHTSGLSSFCYLLTVGFQTRYLLASYLKWKDTLPEGHRGLTGSTGGWRARGWSGQTSPGLESCVKRSPARSLSRSLVHKLVWLRGKNIHQLLLRPCATCSRMNVPEDRVFWAKSKLREDLAALVFTVGGWSWRRQEWSLTRTVQHENSPKAKQGTIVKWEGGTLEGWGAEKWHCYPNQMVSYLRAVTGPWI